MRDGVGTMGRSRQEMLDVVFPCKARSCSAPILVEHSPSQTCEAVFGTVTTCAMPSGQS